MKEERKKVFIVASVPSMIGQFNMLNIQVLQEMGYQVEVGCNFLDKSIWREERIKEFEKELEEKKVKKYQIDFSRRIKRISENWKAYQQLKQVLLETKYEFIHCHTPIGGVLARVVGHKAGIKVIYTAHGFHFYKGAPIHNWLLYYPVEIFLSKWTNILITINQEDYQRAKRFYAGNVEYVPGVGLDLDKINKVNVIKREKKKELGIPEDTIVLLSVGELNKNKNHLIIVKAVAKLRDKRIHYIICGQGKEKEYLQKESKKLGVERQIHLLGYREDVYKIYKMCDIYLHPSRREGLSVALMEAMAAGLPCIVSDIRGNRDLIDKEKGGLYFKWNNSADALGKIQKLAKDKEKRKRMGIYNKRKIEQYSEKIVEKEIRRIYQENYG